MLKRKEWPLWEVFIRSRNGLDHKHCGSVHAPDARMALQAARDVYTRRQEGVSIWVVRADHIVASDPDAKPEMFDPAEDKIYRHPTSTSCRMKWTTCGEGKACPTRLHSPNTDARLADNALILGQRLSEWSGHAPVLEEELALANIALDLIGQSRLLLAHAAKLEAQGRDEDQLAFLRAEPPVPQSDPGRAAQRRFRTHSAAQLPVQRLPAAALACAAELA